MPVGTFITVILSTFIAGNAKLKLGTKLGILGVWSLIFLFTCIL